MKLIHIVGIICFAVGCKNQNQENIATKSTEISTLKNSECENEKILKDIINTDTTTLDNKGKLFWKYNCDSTWLTYITENKEQVILESWVENPELSWRMRLFYLQDFKKYILFQRNVISGCCDLPDNLLFDKKTGREIRNIGPEIWNSSNKEIPLIICFDSKDGLKDRVKSEFERLIIYNLDTDQNFYFSLTRYSFFKDLKEQYFNYSTNLLQEYSVENNILKLKFMKESISQRGQYLTQIIIIDLKNYCS